jgi:hypothetical protein
MDNILEAFLREVRHLGSNGLKASVDFTERAACRFKTTLGSILELLPYSPGLLLSVLP